jgi:ribosomal protein S18 acetylase RimI-like enzyme
MLPNADPLTREVAVRPLQVGEGATVRAILKSLGWDEIYVMSAVACAEAFAAAPFAGTDTQAAFAALDGVDVVGFVLIELHQWNHLAQIQGLAVSPSLQRSGIATALVAHGEQFARQVGARGVYVDTPVTNLGARAFYQAVGYSEGYVMPRYYEDELDGVTYQKFFTRS